MVIDEEIKIKVGKTKLLLAIAIFVGSKNNLKITIAHKTKNINKEKISKKIIDFFLCSLISCKSWSNPKADKTAKEKLNNTIILLCALVETTGIWRLINKSDNGDPCDRINETNNKIRKNEILFIFLWIIIKTANNKGKIPEYELHSA